MTSYSYPQPVKFLRHIHESGSCWSDSIRGRIFLRKWTLPSNLRPAHLLNPSVPRIHPPSPILQSPETSLLNALYSPISIFLVIIIVDANLCNSTKIAPRVTLSTGHLISWWSTGRTRLSLSQFSRPSTIFADAERSSDLHVSHFPRDMLLWILIDWVGLMVPLQALISTFRLPGGSSREAIIKTN